jgi:pimeloyl-ACP methyl ester carboxylesterase
LFQRLHLPGGDSVALDATPPRRADATSFVYLHGLGSGRGGEKALYLEEFFTARGCGFARFDFRGHGDSSGAFEELTISRHLEDVAAVVGHLRSGAAGPPPRRIVLIGASLGALVAAWYSLLERERRPGGGDAPVAAQILIAPAFRIIERHLDALGEFGRERWRREGIYRFVGPWFQFDLKWRVIEDAASYPHARLLSGTSAATLLIHGTQDESAPFAGSRDFENGCAARPRLVAIDGGDHRLTAHKERIADEIARFVATLDTGERTCSSQAAS